MISVKDAKKWIEVGTSYLMANKIKLKNSNGFSNVNDIILIRPEHLPKSSEVRINVKCSNCESINNISIDKDDKFNGLSNVLRVKTGSLQIYYYGADKTMDQAQRTLKFVQDKGFRNAFIVTFNGEDPL